MVKAKEALSGIGNIWKPRQAAANSYSGALREVNEAQPPYIPFLLLKLGEAPWGLQDPACERAAGGEKFRRRRDGVKTRFLMTGHLGLAHLQYIAAWNTDGAWNNFGGLGAMITNLVHLSGPSIFQNMDTASRFGRARGAARVHVARDRHFTAC